MPKFSIHLRVETTIIENISAANEDAAAEKAEALCEDLQRGVRSSRYDWELESEEYEVDDVHEE